MSRRSLVLVLATLAIVPALVPSSPLAAQRRLRVRIEPVEPGEHRVSRVIGQRLVPYHDTQTIGTTTYHSVGTRIEDVWAPLCDAPCTTIVPEEPTRLAIDGVAIDVPFLPRHDATLRVATDRRGAHRAIGALVYSLGLAGTAGIVASIFIDNPLPSDRTAQLAVLHDEDDDVARWIAAGATLFVTQVAGLALLCLRDLASVELIPGGSRF